MKRIKCLIVAIAFSICFQVNAEKKNTSFVEFQPVINGSSSFSMKAGFMRNVNKNVLFGLGAGLSESFDFNHVPYVPLFVRAQVEKKLEDAGITPFVSFDLGYSLCPEDFDRGFIIINPHVGVKFTNIYAGIGYMGNIATSGGSGISSALSIKIGYSFGKDDDAIKRFMRRTYFGIEAGYGFGNSKVDANVYHPDGKEGDKVTLGSNVFMNLTWLYRVNDNWAAGIGIGVKCYMAEVSFKESAVDEFWSGAENTNFSIPLFARGKYTFFERGKFIRPFIACDLGGLIGTDGSEMYSGLLFEPQIGILFKEKLNVSLGMLLADAQDAQGMKMWENSANSINVKIGWDF